MEQSNDHYHGYSSEGLRWLKNNGLVVWDEVEIKTITGSEIRGTILPRNILADTGYITIKLDTGYNLGLKTGNVASVIRVGHHQGKYKIPSLKKTQDKGLPRVVLLGTGGTISSRLDYITGGTVPAFTMDEILSAFPELINIAYIETKSVFNVFSENMSFDHYKVIIKEIKELMSDPTVSGIVIIHGTDTMSFTSSAIAFAIANPSIPIVFTGSQRSSDRPSSDAFFNLYNAILLVTANVQPGIYVVMHGESSDSYAAILNPTRLRKMHSSRRDAFRAMGMGLIGKIEDGVVEMFGDYDNKSSKHNTVILSEFEPKVALIYFHPGLSSELINWYVDRSYKGIVFAGTGLGHLSDEIVKVLEKVNEKDIIVCMTTQCLNGFCGMNVYRNGRLLKKIGVLDLGDMLPETAFIKLSFLLGNYSDIEMIKKLMQKNLRGEMSSREDLLSF